jgi:hypothetical protein
MQELILPLHVNNHRAAACIIAARSKRTKAPHCPNPFWAKTKGESANVADATSAIWLEYTLPSNPVTLL